VCVAVCCSVLQCVAVYVAVSDVGEHRVVLLCVLRCVAVCCSVLWCVAVCVGSVLRRRASWGASTKMWGAGVETKRNRNGFVPH